MSYEINALQAQLLAVTAERDEATMTLRRQSQEHTAMQRHIQETAQSDIDHLTAQNNLFLQDNKKLKKDLDTATAKIVR